MAKERFMGPMQQVIDVYEDLWQDIRKETKLPQPALNILMFFANNPQYDNAKDFVKHRGLKSNIVSFNVDKLVRAGLLEREPVPEDRRKVRLTVTEKAGPLVERGRRVQQMFHEAITFGIPDEDIAKMRETLDRLLANVEVLHERMQRKENR